MTKTLSVVLVASWCAGAAAAPFHALSYEAGGGVPGIAGQGFAVNFGGFFTASGAGDNVVGATAAAMTASNEFQFDSHFSLDGFGPAARNRFMPGPEPPDPRMLFTQTFYGDYGSPGSAGADYNELESTTQNGFGPFAQAGAAFVIGPGSHIGDDYAMGLNPENLARAGIAVAPPPILSHFAPNATGGRSPFNGVFVGRFTIKEGAALSGGMLFTTLVGPGEFDSHHLTLGGPSVLFQTTGGPQHLMLCAYQIDLPSLGLGWVDLVNPSAATADGVIAGNPFGRADVYDLWVRVPAPGAGVVMIGVAGFWRRRRDAFACAKGS